MRSRSINFPITTDRLTIRPLELDDARDLHELYSDAQAMKHLESAIPTTLAESQRWVQEKIDLHEQTGLSLWAVVLKEASTVIGDAGLQLLEDAETVEVGVRIARRWWSQGFGSEAGAAVIAAGFRDLGLARIVAVTGPENVRAIKAMRNHGMRALGTEEHFGREWVVYETTPPDEGTPIG